MHLSAFDFNLLIPQTALLGMQYLIFWLVIKKTLTMRNASSIKAALLRNLKGNNIIIYLNSSNMEIEIEHCD